MASRTSLRSPRVHGAIAPPMQRLRIVGNDEPRIEIVGGARALAIGTGAVRRVERERARRHFRHRDAAADTGEAAREQLIAALVAC